MKKVIFLLSVLSGFLLLGCSTPKALENESYTDVTDEVEGSWQLVSYIDHARGDTSWSQYPDNIIYQKHITPTHFTWLSYDKETDRTTGTGGGTYTHIGELYVEDINFFYPPGSDILGQSIPFTVRMKDGKWYHTGYSKNMEFDAETGEMIIVDSTKIEEIWERVEAHGVKPNEDHSLVGTWELVSYMEPNQEVWSEYPDFVGYIKLITPTHFVFVKYNAEGDEVLFEGGGTYSLEGNNYTENILFMYPSGSQQVGTLLPFSKEMTDDRWYHNGYVKKIETQKETGATVVVDSTRIKEIWKLYKNTL
jgi:hypothetical protein